MLARAKEFDGDDDKLFAEYQQDIESDQPGEFRQELKDRFADTLRVHLHAERERCVIALGQLSADNTADAWKTANTCEGRRQDETVKCDVRNRSWEARDIQLEALGAVRECLPKLAVRLKHASFDDDAEDERDGEVVLDACVDSHRTASPGASTLRRRTVRDVLQDSRDKENILFTCCAPLFHSRLFDHGR